MIAFFCFSLTGIPHILCPVDVSIGLTVFCSEELVDRLIGPADAAVRLFHMDAEGVGIQLFPEGERNGLPPAQQNCAGKLQLRQVLQRLLYAKRLQLQLRLIRVQQGVPASEQRLAGFSQLFVQGAELPIRGVPEKRVQVIALPIIFFSF